MILYIDTTQGSEIEIAIKDGDNIVIEKKFEAPRVQAEKLLPEIDKLLNSSINSEHGKQKLNLKDLTGIEVNNSGGSFTALRIGIITANALGYSLGIPVRGTGNREKGTKNKLDFDVVQPNYDRDPEITQKKKK